MNNCTETRLKGIAAIIAVPEKDLTLTTTAQLSPVVKTGYGTHLTFRRENAIGIGRGKDIAKLIRIIPSSEYATVKDSDSNNIAGSAHTVTVQCNINDDNTEVLSWLLVLERKAHSLILILTNGRYYVVTSTEDSYQFSVNRETNKVSIEFRIHNLMGCQRCTEAVI